MQASVNSWSEKSWFTTTYKKYSLLYNTQYYIAHIHKYLTSLEIKASITTNCWTTNWSTYLLLIDVFRLVAQVCLPSDLYFCLYWAPYLYMIPPSNYLLALSIQSYCCVFFERLFLSQALNSMIVRSIMNKHDKWIAHLPIFAYRFISHPAIFKQFFLHPRYI